MEMKITYSGPFWTNFPHFLDDGDKHAIAKIVQK